ncbi:hypothetical protein Tco_0757663 [Tanacetum coccineum]
MQRSQLCVKRYYMELQRKMMWDYFMCDGCFSWTVNNQSHSPGTLLGTKSFSGTLLHDKFILLRSAQNLEWQSAQIVVLGERIKNLRQG